MKEQPTYARGRGSGRRILAILASAVVLLASVVGVAPASAQTQTGWIPLRCTVNFGQGSFPLDIAATVTATFPDSVAPGEQFNLTGVTGQYVIPVAAQQLAEGAGADLLEGFVRQLWTQTTNATTAFATTAGGAPVNANPSLFNSVGAVQPPNRPATGNPRINGGDATRPGFSDGIGQLNTPPETFSFGDIPIDSSMGNAFGPVPGIGGGFASGAGTPDVLPDIGPITTTGSVGDNVVITATNGPAGLAAVNTIVLHIGGGWSADGSANCSIGGAATNPGPPFVNQFTIPIVRADGVGSMSVRGTDPDADLGAGQVAAQMSGIVNCDETQSTKPFIVRWTSSGTAFTFRKTSVASSTCFSGDGSSLAAGGGEGTVNGVHATFDWILVDGAQVPTPDGTEISIQPDSGPSLSIAGEPQPLNGAPGGVWAFGQLPWPPQ
jgi:hypothetical protein